MSTYQSLAAERVWFITDRGHAAARALETCQCVYRPKDRMLVCAQCGTAVELFRQLPLPRKDKR